MGTYCFDWWERLLVHLFVLTVLGLIVFGLYKQTALLLGLCPWSDLLKAYSTGVAAGDKERYPT